MYRNFPENWEIFRSGAVDGVTYLDAGDPAERDKKYPAPGSSCLCAVCDDGRTVRYIQGCEDECERVCKALGWWED